MNEGQESKMQRERESESASELCEVPEGADFFLVRHTGL
jgi:hypothetical protein